MTHGIDFKQLRGSLTGQPSSRATVFRRQFSHSLFDPAERPTPTLWGHPFTQRGEEPRVSGYNVILLFKFCLDQTTRGNDRESEEVCSLSEKADRSNQWSYDRRPADALLSPPLRS